MNAWFSRWSGSFQHGRQAERMRDVLTNGRWRWVVPMLAVFVLTPSLHAQRQAVKRVPPVYPPIARQIHCEGVVQVTATVDEKGTVVKVESASRFKLLVPAALEAVKQWKFAPGEGVDTVVVDIQFQVS